MRINHYKLLLFVFLIVGLFSQSSDTKNEVIMQKYPKGEIKLIVSYQGEGLDKQVVGKTWFNEDGSKEKEITFNNGDTIYYKTTDIYWKELILEYKDNNRWNGIIQKIISRDDSKVYESLILSGEQIYPLKYETIIATLSYKNGELISINEVYFNLAGIIRGSFTLLNGKLNGKFDIYDVSGIGKDDIKIFQLDYKDGEYKKFTSFKLKKYDDEDDGW